MAEAEAETPSAVQPRAATQSEPMRSLEQGSERRAWRVKIWVQPMRSLEQGWRRGRRCGRWRHWETFWVGDWDDIRDVLQNAGTAGMYHRQCTCIEEWVQDEVTGWWSPEDHV